MVKVMDTEVDAGAFSDFDHFLLDLLGGFSNDFLYPCGMDSAVSYQLM